MAFLYLNDCIRICVFIFSVWLQMPLLISFSFATSLHFFLIIFLNWLFGKFFISSNEISRFSFFKSLKHVDTQSNHSNQYDLSCWLKDRAYNPATKRCRLCLKVKWHTLYKADCATLNRRNEKMKIFRWGCFSHRIYIKLTVNMWTNLKQA